VVSGEKFGKVRYHVSGSPQGVIAIAPDAIRGIKECSIQPGRVEY